MKSMGMLALFVVFKNELFLKSKVSIVLLIVHATRNTQNEIKLEFVLTLMKQKLMLWVGVCALARAFRAS